MQNRIFIKCIFISIIGGALVHLRSLLLFSDTPISQSLMQTGFSTYLVKMGNSFQTAFLPGLAAGFAGLMMVKKLRLWHSVCRVSFIEFRRFRFRSFVSRCFQLCGQLYLFLFHFLYCSCILWYPCKRSANYIFMRILEYFQIFSFVFDSASVSAIQFRAIAHG